MRVGWAWLLVLGVSWLVLLVSWHDGPIVPLPAATIRIWLHQPLLGVARTDREWRLGRPVITPLPARPQPVFLLLSGDHNRKTVVSRRGTVCQPVRSGSDRLLTVPVLDQLVQHPVELVRRHLVDQ